MAILNRMGPSSSSRSRHSLVDNSNQQQKLLRRLLLRTMLRQEQARVKTPQA